jgi:hypothetical protein
MRFTAACSLAATVAIACLLASAAAEAATWTALPSDYYFAGSGFADLTIDGSRDFLQPSSFSSHDHKEGSISGNPGWDAWTAIAGREPFPYLEWGLGDVQGSISGEAKKRLSGYAGGGEGPPPGLDPAIYGNEIGANVFVYSRYTACRLSWDNYPMEPSDDRYDTAYVNGHTSAGTVNGLPDANGFLFYRIDPLMKEKAGDAVRVEIYATLSVDKGQLGGFIGNGSASYSFLLNGQPIVVPPAEESNDYSPHILTAAIGDVIGMKLSASANVGGSGEVKPKPPNEFANDWLYAYGMAYAGVNMTLDPMPGLAENAPLMPGTPPATPGEPFIFDCIIVGDTGPGADCPLWFDPLLVTMYEIHVTGGLAAAVVLPSASALYDEDGFNVWHFDGTQWVLDAEGSYWGTRIDFPEGVTAFRIGDIEVDPPLDPQDPQAFPVGIIFDGPGTNIGVTMTPMPEPATLALLALGAVALLRRNRR